jgi:hypothetical protein
LLVLVERQLRDAALRSDGYRLDEYGDTVRIESEACACSLRGDLLLWDRVSLPLEAVANIQKRFQLYRMIYRFMYGHLHGGRGERVELPECCVEAVKELYPDPSGAYVGFKPFKPEVVEENDPDDENPKKRRVKRKLQMVVVS